MDRNLRRDVAVWAGAIGVDIVLLLAAHAGIAFLATLLLAAAWCIKVEAETHAVQMLDSDAPVANR